MSLELDPPRALVEDFVQCAFTLLRCTSCGVEEHVMPMDDKPLDELFVANYLCDECEPAISQPVSDRAP